MPVGLLGKKVGMTQVYAEDGSLVPVTVLEAGPCVVLQLRTKEVDGYEAVQIGTPRKRFEKEAFSADWLTAKTVPPMANVMAPPTICFTIINSFAN